MTSRPFSTFLCVLVLIVLLLLYAPVFVAWAILYTAPVLIFSVIYGLKDV